MTVPWKEGQMQVSREEYDLRWDYATTDEITEEELNKRITEIRERTGKP
jgi:hypothetical protein